MSTTETAVRDAQGRFVAGNPLWQLHAFNDGHQGLRPNKYTPKEMALAVAEYCQDRLDNNRRITWAGMRGWLGLSHEGIRKYRDGEYGKGEDIKRAYVAIFDRMSALIEDGLEESLLRDKGQVSGVIFALKNQYGERWKDERHLTTDTRMEQTLIVQLPPGDPLAQRLQHGITVDGECTPVPGDGESLD